VSFASITVSVSAAAGVFHRGIKGEIKSLQIKQYHTLQGSRNIFVTIFCKLVCFISRTLFVNYYKLFLRLFLFKILSRGPPELQTHIDSFK